MNILDYIGPVSLVIFVVGGVFFSGWLKIIKETNSLLKSQNEELKIANKELSEKHEQNLKQMASMQAQIEDLKSIPLVNIDTTLKRISDFNQSLAESNDKILHTLQSSAVVLAKNTKDASQKVKEVKTDLENA